MASIDRKLKSEKESEAFEYIVRAQLVPNNTRTDVMFAKDEIFGHCFVKGPYLTNSTIKYHAMLHDWKKANGLPVVDYYFANLYPDVWPEGTPLGQRNKTNRNQKYTFMVMESLLETTKPETIIRDLDKEKDGTTKGGWKGKIELLESDKSWEPLKMWNSVSDKVKKDFTVSMIYRSMIGADDLADRNFVLKGDTLYSIDEDIDSIGFTDLFHQKSKWKRYGYKKFEMIFMMTRQFQTMFVFSE